MANIWEGFRGLPLWGQIAIVAAAIGLVTAPFRDDAPNERRTSTNETSRDAASSELPTLATEGIHPFIEARVLSLEPIDEANLGFTARMENSGDETAHGECVFRATDASGATVGFDIFTSRQRILPGKHVFFRGVLRIEDLGAFRVQRVRAHDCEAA